MLRKSKRRPLPISTSTHSRANRRRQPEDDDATGKQLCPVLPPRNPVHPVAQVPAPQPEVLHRYGPEVTSHYSYDACEDRHGDRRDQEGGPLVWRKSSAYPAGQAVRRHRVEHTEAKDDG